MKNVHTQHTKNSPQHAAVRFTLTCPECGAASITPSPVAAVWELCPSCRRHVWDVYDAMMAEAYTPDLHVNHPGSERADN